MSWPALVRAAFVTLWFVVLAGATTLQAATTSNVIGVRLLQAQLPAGVTLPQADCEQLARAVRLATRSHRKEAPAILSAALSYHTGPNDGSLESIRPCGCVRRIFRESVEAAPDEASRLLEVASALYPDCADALGLGLRDGFKTDADDASNGAGFGVGFGPGFPGSPGFTGSPPSGEIALPPVAETSVTNG